MKKFVLGIGKTKFGVLADSLPQLIYDAVCEALRDSGLKIKNIKTVFIGNFLGGIYQNQLHLGSLFYSLFPDFEGRAVRVEGACAASGLAANLAIESLHKEEFSMAIGVEKMNGVKNSIFGIASASDMIFDQEEGIIFPAGYALMAQAYFKKYKATSDDLALVSLKNHQNANKNQKAHFYGKKVNLEMIKNSPMVSTPLRLFDCSPISDGAAAIIFGRKKISKKSIRVLASSAKHTYISLSQFKDITKIDSASKAAKQAYEEAGIKAKDIDLAEVHDCFTIAEIIASEDLGFFRRGKGYIALRKGKTKINAEKPINPSGGLKAGGHPIGATGAAQIYEAVSQLRGEAGEHQVKNPQIALCHNVGGFGGTCVIHIFSR